MDISNPRMVELGAATVEQAFTAYQENGFAKEEDRGLLLSVFI
jgi:hypothetical protein